MPFVVLVFLVRFRWPLRKSGQVESVARRGWIGDSDGLEDRLTAF